MRHAAEYNFTIMPIVFAGVCSHSPLLLEGIGRDHRDALQSTVRSCAELERQLYATRPETIVVISPHGEAASEDLVLAGAPEFAANFERFGDFRTHGRWSSDPATAQRIRAADESQQHAFRLRFSSQSQLDHGVSVPLLLLGSHLPEIKLLAVHTSTVPATVHWQFGHFLGDQLRSVPRRFAVIASTDLSHRLTPNSPAGFSPLASGFDRLLLELVRRGDTAGVVNLDAATVLAVACCGYLPIVVLLGILDGMRGQPVVLGYEAPFGIGHLVMHFDLTA